MGKYEVKLIDLYEGPIVQSLRRAAMALADVAPGKFKSYGSGSGFAAVDSPGGARSDIKLHVKQSDDGTPVARFEYPKELVDSEGYKKGLRMLGTISGALTNNKLLRAQSWANTKNSYVANFWLEA